MSLSTEESLIAGNGPSGIVLSYMLSGHWPFYVGQSHDEFLHARLMVEPELSLVEQDLQFLSEVRADSDVYLQRNRVQCWTINLCQISK